MIYVTGDTHGDYDWSKLNSTNFPEGKNLTKNDYVIVCGDFAAVWNGGNFDKYIQNWYDSKPWTTLFVDGNHENHDLINSYPVELWNGGKVHKISSSVIHLMRGQIFNINGSKFFTMGGADSTDKYIRKEGISWWSNEMPSDEEYEEALDNLNKTEIDYIIAHCGPDTIQNIINPNFEHNRLTNFLEVVCSTYKFKHFYCGHYHVDKNLGKFSILYNNVEVIE